MSRKLINIFLISTALLTSCKKDISKETPNAEINSISQSYQVQNGMLVFSDYDELATYVEYIRSSSVDDILTDQANIGFESYYKVMTDILVDLEDLGETPESEITEEDIDNFADTHADVLTITSDGWEALIPPNEFRHIANSNFQFAIVDTIFTVTEDSIYVDTTSGQKPGRKSGMSPKHTIKWSTIDNSRSASKTTGISMPSPGHTNNWDDKSTNCGSGALKWRVKAYVAAGQYNLYSLGYNQTWEQRYISVGVQHMKRGAFGRWYPTHVYINLTGTHSTTWSSGGPWTYYNIHWTTREAHLTLKGDYFFKSLGFYPYYDKIYGNVDGHGQSYFQCNVVHTYM